MLSRSAARLLLLATVFASAAHAEDDKRTSASFRFFSFDGADRAPLYAEAPGGRMITLDRPSTYIGAPVRIRFEGAIPVYDKPLTDASKSGAGAKPAPALLIKPGAEARQLVLLFQDKGSRRAIVIPDSAETFPFGACLVVNMTKKALNFSYGETATVIPAGAMRRGAPPKTRTAAGDVVVQLAAEVDGAPRLVYSTVWRHSEKVRMIVFVVEDSTGAFQVRPIRSADVPELNEAPADKLEKSGARTAAAR